MTEDRKCGKCLWRDDCEYETPCDFYYDGQDEPTDEEIERYIEDGRKKFYREWFQYISQYE